MWKYELLREEANVVSAKRCKHKGNESEVRGHYVPLPDHDEDELRHECLRDVASHERVCSSDGVSYKAEERIQKY